MTDYLFPFLAAYLVVGFVVFILSLITWIAILGDLSDHPDDDPETIKSSAELREALGELKSRCPNMEFWFICPFIIACSLLDGIMWLYTLWTITFGNKELK